MDPDLPEYPPPPRSDRLAAVERVVVVVLFLALGVIGCIQIANRHGLNLPVWNLEQVLPDLFIAMTFLGMSLMYRHRSHLSVEILPNSLPPAIRRRFQLLLWFVTVAFLLALVFTSVGVIAFQLEINALTAIGYPSAILMATLPIGATLSIWRIWQIEIHPRLREGRR